jgi:hypothetical protein
MIRNYLSLFFDTRFTVSESAVNPPKVVQTISIIEQFPGLMVHTVRYWGAG